jgi:hypothetical protein
MGIPNNNVIAFVAQKRTAPPPAPAYLDQLKVGPQGELIVGSGLYSKLHVTTAQVIKAGPARLVKVLVISPGSGTGSFVFNDCATLADATTANQVYAVPFGSLTVGQIITPDFPCELGLVLSAVPTTGAPQLSVAFS